MLGWPGVWCMVQRIINIYMLYPAPPSAQPLTVGIIITQAGVAAILRTHQHILHSIEIPCQALNSKPKSFCLRSRPGDPNVVCQSVSGHVEMT